MSSIMPNSEQQFLTWVPSTLENSTQPNPCMPAVIIVDGSADLGSTLGGLAYIIYNYWDLISLKLYEKHELL